MVLKWLRRLQRLWRKKPSPKEETILCPRCNNELEWIIGIRANFLQCIHCEEFYLDKAEIEKGKQDMKIGKEIKKQYEFEGEIAYI